MEESKGKRFTNWIQDSLQAIIIIMITLLILFFLIYSYSKKSSNEGAIVDDKAQQEEIIDEIPVDEARDNDSRNKANDTEAVKPESTTNRTSENDQTQTTVSPTENSTKNADRGKGPSTETEIKNNNSQQKDGEITVTANYGDSLTHLARKATAQYISENNVEGLTPAHKIYIEDSLQKDVSNRTVAPGTSVSFSNESIDTAIQSAKNLNNIQLQNLNVYTNYVSGL